MLKIGNFEVNHDGSQWLVYEWRMGISKETKKPKQVKTGPKFYSSLVNVARYIIDKSAGNACAEGDDILSAIKSAQVSMHIAMCGGGWNPSENKINEPQDDTD